MLGLARYEAGVCDCGFHESVIDPRHLAVTFDDRVCPICAGGDQWSRYLAKKDEEFLEGLGKNPPAKTARPSDGRRTFIKPIDPAAPAADTTTKRRAVDPS